MSKDEVYIDQSGNAKLVFNVFNYQDIYRPENLSSKLYKDIYHLYNEDIIFLKENYRRYNHNILDTPNFIDNPPGL
jgi:hypothetical protein